MYLVEFQDIKKRYGNKSILDKFSLKIKEGEILGLIGRSGSGKSTVLKLLIGMIDIDSGNILFNGKNIQKNLSVLRKQTGFATQENMLIDELSIKENSIYFGKLQGMKLKELKYKFNELINLLDLGGFEHFSIKNLSGGMIKRANLLVSLIHSPKLLILDEPTTGLDMILRENLWRYILQINKAGTTIFVTSHLLEEIEKNCNRIAILSQNGIVACGTMPQYSNAFPGKTSLNKIFENLLKNETTLHN